MPTSPRSRSGGTATADEPGATERIERMAERVVVPAQTPPKKVRKPRVVKERKPLTLGAVVARPVTDRTAMAKARRQRVARDDQQKAVDAIVEQTYELWKSNGRPDPTKWVDLAGSAMSLEVKEDEVDTLIWLIRKAGLYYQVRIRFGDVKKRDGNAVVVFVATDRPNGETEEDDTDDAPGEVTE